MLKNLCSVMASVCWQNTPILPKPVYLPCTSMSFRKRLITGTGILVELRKVTKEGGQGRGDEMRGEEKRRECEEERTAIE